MSEKMTPIPFQELLFGALQEYREKETIYGIKINDIRVDIPIGPAAGPHTQLAQNIVAAYIAGANYMELKTVQVLEGEALGIPKPCIYAKHEVYNVEWSTELTVEQALAEYQKAYLLIWALRKLLKIHDSKMPEMVMSVGYTLEGIQSAKIDGFIEGMKDAAQSQEWKRDLDILSSKTDIPAEEIERLKQNGCISDTITLSTMHGCPPEEIKEITAYLLKEKHLNTYIKLNPTLIGEEKVREILTRKGYTDITYDQQNFTHDCTLEMIADIVKECQNIAKEKGLIFGVKMTNTFPVKIKHQELSGEQMYMSGPALFALALNAASEMEQITENLPISFSGGIDEKNIVPVIETGISPITVCSILLKPEGYHNISKLIKVSKECTCPDHINSDRLKREAANAVIDEHYHKKTSVTFPKLDGYDTKCAKCHNCVNVCPNRANSRIKVNDKDVVIHRNRLCNECGCCSCWCIMGHDPYLEKITLYENKEEFLRENPDREAIFYDGENFQYRKGGELQELSQDLKKGIQDMVTFVS